MERERDGESEGGMEGDREGGTVHLIPRVSPSPTVHLRGRRMTEREREREGERASGGEEVCERGG